MNENVDVVIVGAGLAGLSAARCLQQKGKSVQIIEARERVGGRTVTQQLEDGKWVDLGGQWLGPTQTEMYALCEEFGIKTHPTFNTGQNLLIRDGKTLRYDSDVTPPFSVLASLDLLRSGRQLNQLSESIDTEEPWNHPNAQKLDGQTFESWIQRNLFTKYGRKFYQLISESVLATESSDFSLLHALFFFKSGGGFDNLLKIEGGAQQDIVIGGTQQISIRLAEQIGTQNIHLNSPVRRIEQDATGVRVITDTGSYSGHFGIVTLSPTLAGRLVYSPPLPPLRDQLTQRVPQGSVIKMMAFYEKPFWREMGLTGQVFSDVGPIKMVFDNSPPDGKPGILLGFMEGNDARRATERSESDRKKIAIECFARYFGTQANNPIDYIEKDWMSEEYSRGCYGAHFAPGVWTAFGEVLRKPVDRIYWAGTESAAIWNGYMEGAVRSGKAAASLILQQL